MQTFQAVLARSHTKNVGNIQAFSQEFTSDQTLLGAAQYPKDYAVVSKDARRAIRTLDLLGLTYNQLATFNETIAQMKAANLDITVMQTQYQNDLDAFNKAIAAPEFQ